MSLKLNFSSKTIDKKEEKNVPLAKPVKKQEKPEVKANGSQPEQKPAKGKTAQHFQPGPNEKPGMTVEQYKAIFDNATEDELFRIGFPSPALLETPTETLNREIDEQIEWEKITGFDIQNNEMILDGEKSTLMEIFEEEIRNAKKKSGK